MKKPALGLIEFKSVARGIATTDVMVKKSDINILATHPTCPGKYMVLIGGDVGEVEAAMKAGVAFAGDLLINDLFLPLVSETVIPAITGTAQIGEIKSIGIIETFSIASAVQAADIAVKTAPVELIEIRLANGLGGKAYFVFTGELFDVEAALEAAGGFVKKDGLLACQEVIASPHPDLLAKGFYW